MPGHLTDEIVLALLVPDHDAFAAYLASTKALNDIDGAAIPPTGTGFVRSGSEHGLDPRPQVFINDLRVNADLTDHIRVPLRAIASVIGSTSSPFG